MAPRVPDAVGGNASGKIGNIGDRDVAIIAGGGETDLGGFGGGRSK